jgi:WD40 repeat protein
MFKYIRNIGINLSFDLRLSPPTLLHQFRATHQSPVSVMRTLISNVSGKKTTILATGSSDFTVRIWDLAGFLNKYLIDL